MNGSSPRSRGTLEDLPLHGCHRRFIPALAGNTSGNTTARNPRSVHPRARGEHGARPRSRGPAVGSSPRSRGTRGVRTRFEFLLRFIPALAGNTPPAETARRGRAVHPRARGEHKTETNGKSRPNGSSPRSRGTPAGMAAEPAGPTVHPRARGEHLTCAIWISFCAGSSPRSRGTQAALAREDAGIRFIPALAGNTDGGVLGIVGHRVHPRARGEHLECLERIVMEIGSSPRSRGTRNPGPELGPGGRFIPALAGNTA